MEQASTALATTTTAMRQVKCIRRYSITCNRQDMLIRELQQTTGLRAGRKATDRGQAA